MNFLEKVKECEQNVTIIAKDAGCSRQAVYRWQTKLPRLWRYEKLVSMEKYDKLKSLSGIFKAP